MSVPMGDIWNGQEKGQDQERGQVVLIGEKQRMDQIVRDVTEVYRLAKWVTMRIEPNRASRGTRSRVGNWTKSSSCTGWT